MRIAAVAKASPPHYYDQEQLIAAFRAYYQANNLTVSRLEQFHRNAMVGGRHLALPLEAYPQLTGWGQANQAWQRVAIELAEAATARVVDRAAIRFDQIGAIFFVSVTGVATPSVEAQLMNRLPFSAATKRIPIFGLGCVAGAAGVARAADYVRAFPDQAALLISVELCSLTVQKNDLTPASLIASGLFGDGAAAVIVAGEQLDSHPGPRIVDSRSVFYPNTEELMGWKISEHGFGVVLSPQVPLVARERLPHDVDRFLHDHGIQREQIRAWICHPGGPKVLEAIEQGLNLPRQALELTWTSLRDVGNLSSASVLFVLEDTLRQRTIAEGEFGLLLAMGPGFCSELVLLRW
jgi:alkylresorcinol/alkylpyrone synthase